MKDIFIEITVQERLILPEEVDNFTGQDVSKKRNGTDRRIEDIPPLTRAPLLSQGNFVVPACRKSLPLGRFAHQRPLLPRRSCIHVYGRDRSSQLFAPTVTGSKKLRRAEEDRAKRIPFRKLKMSAAM